MYCWGANSNGQIGNGTTTNAPSPVAITGGALAGKTVTQVSAGSNTSCATGADGKAYCWGNNLAGQLGNGGTVSSQIPVAVQATGVLAGQSVAEVHAGASSYGCALTTTRALYCWGNNGSSQFGRGMNTSSYSPVAAFTAGTVGTKLVTKFVAGADFICSSTSDDLAFCAGFNGTGQLGNGSTTSTGTPVLVPVPTS